MNQNIAHIKIGSRFRKDLGDIDALAQSIQEIGLLQSITVNSDKKRPEKVNFTYP